MGDVSESENMNTPLEKFFDKILVVNLDRRTDRWQQVVEMFVSNGVGSFHRFRGHDRPVNHDGRISANMGCTASHRGVLEVIAHAGWRRTLVVEDDTLFLENFQSRFAEATATLSTPFDFLFLGGSYAENPKRRINKYFVQTNGLMTTSSYGITAEMAHKMAPYISGDVGIDSLFHQFQRDNVCLMMTPRLAIQRPSYSDIQERDCDNSMSMLDERHESMLLEGEWGEDSCGMRTLNSQLYRRELAGQRDMDGEEVIVRGELWRVGAVVPPTKIGPWYRGCKMTYLLAKP